MEHVFGTLTLVFGVAMAAIALPSQAYKNYRDKRCGFNFMIVLLTICVYGSRIAYSVTIAAWYMLVPDVIGMVFGIIIFIQFFQYRHAGGS